METTRAKLIGFRRKSDKGFTLLEYCAGAAIIAGVVWVALSQFGGQLGGFYRALGDWAGNRTASLQN